MKNFKNTLIYAFPILVIILLISCSGEDGAVGPSGNDGQNGENGIDGNANVTTVLLENTSLIIGNNIFNVNAITQEILDYGAVLVYVRASSAPNIWYTLPYSEDDDRMSIFSITQNEITINSNFIPYVLDLKLVIIAGNSTATSKNSNNEILASLEKNGIDVNNYNQLAEFYNLEQ
ncbi:hypothetical protein [Arenibacter palladensis]|uniref:hypothetical protein n=1 Tax=Arenibacter palladensis TaxID=237373 RepID=UPI0026E1B5CF|nr:hypothetical protein [Arenibacter palladensis]MDO6605711.1 hypothetical protein [Arenibacter palladensis]